MFITEKQIREIIRKNLIKEHQKERKILKESKLYGTGNVSNPIIGPSCNNNFLKDFFKNDRIGLSKDYTKAITEIQVEDIDQNDLDIIWTVFDTEILQSELQIDVNPATQIKNIFINLQNKLGNSLRVFEIFEKQNFPLQEFEYKTSSGAKNLYDLAQNINNVTRPVKDCYDAIFANNAKSGQQTFSTGKGEYLCVLLTKNAKAGGTNTLDVLVGDESYDIKQTTAKANTLKVTLSGASGVKPKKMKFIEIYSELGRKIYEMKSELETLGVEKELLDFLESTKGITGMGVAKRPKPGEEEEQFLAFETLMEVYIDALRKIRKLTYKNLQSIQNSFATTNKSNLTYLTPKTAKDQQNINLQEDFVQLLKNVYEINLFQVTIQGAIGSNRIKEIEDIKNNFEEIPGAKGFDILKTDYNNNKNGTCFEIDVDYFPIFIPEYDSITQKEWQSVITYAKNLGPGNKNAFKLIVKDFEDILMTDHLNSQNYPYTNINNNKTYNNEVEAITTNSKRFEKFRTLCNRAFNKQYLISNNNFEKIIKEQNLANKRLATTGSIDSSSIGEFVIEEPIDIDQQTGEFVVDISFYKNKKKRHIDTLHSEDLNVTSKGGAITKTGGKEGRITGGVSSKNRQGTLDLRLKNVISDRDEINKKVKSYELVGLLQPHILEKVFGKDTIAGKNIDIKRKKGIEKYSGTRYNIDPSLQKGKGNPMSIQFDPNAIKKPNSFARFQIFKKEVEEISKSIDENNILSLFFKLLDELENLEKQIIKHYAEDHHIIVIKESSGKGIQNAFSWTTEIVNKINPEKGIIRNIVADGVLCEADTNRNLNPAKKTLKSEILAVYEQIKNLTLEIQDTAQR